ncbi:MAG TPA: hypothetical protein VF771_17650 [Longimicrobiaceae bacterium]
MAKTEKEFDAVRLMRSLREEIDREVERLTPEQRREYIRRRADRVRAELGLAPAPEPAVFTDAG